jgi:hypothetical protein
MFQVPLVGHILFDCNMNFTKTFQGYPQGHAKEPSIPSTNNVTRAPMELFPHPRSGDGMVVEMGSVLLRETKEDILVGDYVNTLKEVFRGNEVHCILKDLLGEELNPYTY